MRIVINTPYGKRYFVNRKGDIFYDGLNPSGGWKFLGLSHVKRREIIPFPAVWDKLEKGEKINTLWKNGKPQYTVRDLDHGTTREWGNTKYHGIKSIYMERIEL